MKKYWRTIVVFVVVFVVLACLPVIPIRTAPVTPRPVYTIRFVSLVGMVWRFGRVGVSYQGGWYVCAALLVLILLGLAIGVYTSRRLGRGNQL